MKTLLKFANENGLKLAVLTFRSHGHTQIGYAICAPIDSRTGYEVATIEPYFESNGTRWVLKQAGARISWHKNLRELSKSLTVPTDPTKINRFITTAKFVN